MRLFIKILLVSFFLLNSNCSGIENVTENEVTNETESKLDGIPQFIVEGLSDWDIPGLAIAIVHQDEVIFSEGFGVLHKERDELVTSETLFGVASTTKAMTATVLGILVDQGKLNWDDAVVDYLPDFRLHDDWVTSHITVRDLLTHRSGYGRMTGNRLQYMTHEPRSELLYRLRYLEPEAEFRTRYVYSNMMYMVAGEVIRSAGGFESWDDAIQQLLFEPLGMHNTNTSITQIADDDNAAWPHQYIKGEVVPIPRRNFDNVGASASVNTSADDFARWIRFNLGEAGVLDDNRIVSEQTMREIFRSHMTITQGNPYGDLVAYGLGWRLAYYNGIRTLSHGGASDGMNTSFVIVPELDLGIVVMTNTFNLFREALVNTILDRFMQVDDARDWNQIYLDSYQRRFDAIMAERKAIHDSRTPDTKPTIAILNHAGSYYDSLYAQIEVFYDDGNLSIKFWDDETLIADLEHWEDDVWRAVWRNPAQREKFVEFIIEDSQIKSLDITFNLRPQLLQVGVYPSNYTRTVSFIPQGN